jgi:hypothetical protein
MNSHALPIGVVRVLVGTPILREWALEILLDGQTLSRGYFKRSAIEQMMKQGLGDPACSREIFSLVVLELWHRAIIDGEFAHIKHCAIPAPLHV